MPSTINSTTTAGVAVSGDNSGVLALQTNNGTTAVTIDTSQNVGIGTASPAYKLQVRRAGGVASLGIQLDNTVGFIRDVQYYSVADSTSDTTGHAFYVRNGTATDNLALRISNTGTITLQGGSTGATGVGITFPATQSASSDANTLDDYEEGTFTPTYFGSTTAGTTTYAAGGQVGSYVKIGNRVYCELCLNWTNQTGTGDGLVGGLPFVVGGYSPDSRSLFLMPAYQGYSITGILTGITQSAGTTIILYAINNGSLAGSARQTSGLIRCQFWYITST